MGGVVSTPSAETYDRAARRRAAVVEAELVAGARQGQGRGGEREA